MVELATVDFTDAFHTIGLDKKERLLHVFESGGVDYAYWRLPFGLASAPLSIHKLSSCVEAQCGPFTFENEKANENEGQ